MVNPRLISFLLAAYRSSDSRVLITFDLRDRGEEGQKHEELVIVGERVPADPKASIHRQLASGELLPAALYPGPELIQTWAKASCGYDYPAHPPLSGV